MLIGFISYFSFTFDKPYDEHRENGNLRYSELKKIAKDKNITLEIYNKSKHHKYDLIVFLNEPRIQNLILVLLRNLFKKKVNIFYLAEETPISRKRLSLIFPFIYKKAIINSFHSNQKRTKRNFFLFTQPGLPNKKDIKNKKEFILKNERKKTICFVGKNSLSISKKGSYKFRNKLLRRLSKYQNFSLYGRKWDQAVIPFDFPFIAIINRFSLLNKLLLIYFRNKYPPIQNNGPVFSKLNTLNEYNFTLAIEPYTGSPKMLLEKIFDPMLCGSIPVYFGHKEIDVPSNIYIRIDENINTDKLMTYLNSFKEKELREYRKRIYDYLLSDDANKYRFQYWAYKIVDLFESEK